MSQPVYAVQMLIHNGDTILVLDNSGRLWWSMLATAQWAEPEWRLVRLPHVDPAGS